MPSKPHSHAAFKAVAVLSFPGNLEYEDGIR